MKWESSWRPFKTKSRDDVQDHHGAFKDNKNLSYGFLTGILRIAQESIFSGLNNLTVNTVMNPEYDQFFGFTEDEVDDILAYYGVSGRKEELQPDGAWAYRFDG